MKEDEKCNVIIQQGGKCNAVILPGDNVFTYVVLIWLDDSLMLSSR
jgi:hypothetical protein